MDCEVYIMYYRLSFTMQIVHRLLYFQTLHAVCLLAKGSSAELRELAAEGLGELVEVTSEESLRPFTVQITGAAHVCLPEAVLHFVRHLS